MRPVFIYSLFVLIVFTVYYPCLNYDFVWDDHDYLVNNKSILETPNLLSYFTDAQTFSQSLDAKIYRPIRNICYWLEYQFWGMNSSGFHFDSLLIHSVNCILLYVLCRQLFSHLLLSILLAILFCVHPINPEVVCWIKSRDDLLCSLFALTSLLSYFKYVKNKNLLLYMMSISCFALCLFSKEAGAGLLFVFIYLILKSDQLESKQKIGQSLCLIVVSLLYLFMRTGALNSLNQGRYIGGTFWNTQLGMAKIYLQYLSQLLIGLPQRVNYMGYDPFTCGIPCLVLMWIGLSLSFIGLWSRFKTSRVYLIFLVFSFLPVSNIMPMMQWQADRFLYFPMLFYFLLTASLLKNIFSQKKYFRFILIFFSFYLGFLTWSAVQRHSIWKNNKTLGLSMLESNPYSYHGLALVLEYNQKHKDFSENIALGSQFLERFPNEEIIYHYLAYAYINTKEYEKAKRVTEKGLKWFPDSTLLKRFHAFLVNQEKRFLGSTPLNSSDSSLNSLSP
ncbi:MAG: glycosyltransferase family 39 protein [Candidatus Aureabacteria bacterium]|nr:glycosyltransferase family 39 protein [Candidatus Auribacterota bacterium]